MTSMTIAKAGLCFMAVINDLQEGGQSGAVIYVSH